MSRRELKKLAKSQIKGNVIILFLILLIAGIDTFLFQAIGQPFTNSMGGIITNKSGSPNLNITAEQMASIFNPSILIYGSIIWIISIIFISVLKVSACHAFLEVSNGEKAKFSMLGYGFKNCWEQSVLLSIFKDIFVFLWCLLLIIPGIIKSYSYSMAEYILADNPNMTALEAITKSRKMMKGHKFQLFVLDLSFFFWYLLILITLGLASIYVDPYMQATKTNFYLKIKEMQNT